MWRGVLIFSLMTTLMVGVLGYIRAQASPQGELLFTAGDIGAAIYARRGEAIRRVSPPAPYIHLEFCPLASPNSLWIGYQVYYIDSDAYLNVMNRFGQYRRELFPLPYGDCSFFWSPDSQWLYFVSWENHLQRVRIRDGSIETVLALEGADWRGMTLSPDGEWIAFGQNGLLTVANLATGEIRQSDLAHSQIINITWAERGGIVYTARDIIANEAVYRLFRVSDAWTSDYLANGYLARWSHDGTMLVYHSENGVMLYDGKQAQLVGEGAGSYWLEYFGANADAPLWSADDHTVYWEECDLESANALCTIVTYTPATGAMTRFTLDCQGDPNCDPAVQDPNLLPMIDKTWHQWPLLGLGVLLGLVGMAKIMPYLSNKGKALANFN